MLHLDIQATLAKAITPSMGIPDQELTALRTSMKRHAEDWLKERTKGQHAWSMDPYNKQMIEHVKEAAMRIKAERIRTVVWIGIGGSGLGPKVIQEIFETPDTVELLVIDTIDPSVLKTYMDLIDWKSAFVIVASKSGDTLEPMSVFFLCFEKLKESRKEKATERVLALTDPKNGTLRTFCLDQGIPMLPIPSAVGGRFCIFTSVGLLPLAILGGDVSSFVRGAKEIGRAHV